MTASYVPSLFESLLASVALYWVATWMRERVPIFSRYCIPVPLIAGFLFVVFLWPVEKLAAVQFSFSGTVQSVAMAAFFACIGLLASIKNILRGSVRLVWFYLACVLLIVLQDGVGMGLASILGLQKHYGLLAGSVSMAGGVGTAAVFGLYLETTYAVAGAPMIGLLAAALGMLVSLLLGPAIGRWLVWREQLENRSREAYGPDALQSYGQEACKRPANPRTMAVVVGAVALCVFFGMGLSQVLAGLVKVPGFVGAFVCGVILRALSDFSRHQAIANNACESVISICLAYLLGVAFLGTDWSILWQLSLPLTFILLVQVFLTVLFALSFIYWGFGRDYESMMLCVGLIGFGLGATATALAGMFALGERYGHSERAIVIVSLTGGFLIDLVNGVLIVLFAAL